MTLACTRARTLMSPAPPARAPRTRHRMPWRHWYRPSPMACGSRAPPGRPACASVDRCPARSQGTAPAAQAARPSRRLRRQARARRRSAWVALAAPPAQPRPRGEAPRWPVARGAQAPALAPGQPPERTAFAAEARRFRWKARRRGSRCLPLLLTPKLSMPAPSRRARIHSPDLCKHGTRVLKAARSCGSVCAHRLCCTCPAEDYAAGKASRQSMLQRMPRLKDAQG